MLRYFYILLLVTDVKWCFCDNDIANQDSAYKHVHSKFARNPIGKLSKDGIKNRRYRQIINYEQEEEAPIAQINVANFLSSNSHEEDNNRNTVDDDDSYELEKKTPSAIDWNENLSSNLQNVDFNEPQITENRFFNGRRHNLRFNREMNIGDLQNGAAIRKNQQEDSLDSAESRHSNSDVSHHPQKKCAFKHVRIPFFSHDKSTKANKKGKKRKYFGGKKENNKIEEINVSKKKEENHAISSTASANVITPNIKVRKRSPFVEYICPVCKSVFKSNERFFPRVRRLTNDVVHNSRQYFEKNHRSRNPKALEIESKDPEDIDSLNSLENLEIRLARQSPSDEEAAYNNSNSYDRMQQLRELEEVERRINEIGEKTKIFEKSKSHW